MARLPRRKASNRNHTEARMVRNLDALAAFEEFQDEVLPMLRQDLAKGLTAEDIYKKYQALAAARNISIALADPDSGKALAAIKDILDRSGGKPTERKELTHKMANVSDAELDSLLLSKLDKDEETDDESDRTAH